MHSTEAAHRCAGAASGALRFYFTAHPGDLSRSRLLPGCHILLVAAAHWDGRRQRLHVRRPPTDHVASLAVDSGGFTAARRWGRYPWSPQQYADFVQDVSRDVPLDWCASMDYACEPAVDRSPLGTNHTRIEATLQLEPACRQVAPHLPWLPVLQGDTLAERAYDLARRQQEGLVPPRLAGVGSLCGRGACQAIQTLGFYRIHLPGVRFHGFGLHVQALDDDTTFAALASWDSYGWTWGKGQKGVDRPPAYLRQPGETCTQFTQRLAALYWQHTVAPRLTRPLQRTLW
jgi:hypothetical protein